MTTAPAVNIVETEDGYKISVAAPSLKKDHVIIDVQGSLLIISSQKEENNEEKDEWHIQREYNYSSL